MKYLGQDLPQDFIDKELAEPEPGKRYTIGSQLLPELQVSINALKKALVKDADGMCHSPPEVKSASR